MNIRFPKPPKRILRSAALLLAIAAIGPIGVTAPAQAQAQQQGTATIHVGDDRLALDGRDTVLRVTQSIPESRWILRQGDVVLAANGQPTRVPEDYFSVLRQTPVNGSVSVQVRRDGANRALTVPRANYGNSIPPAPPSPPPTPR